MEGVKGTPYEGGFYHGIELEKDPLILLGKLIFPREYPYKPPSVLMLTPNGRFKENVRLCLSMSDYHPELWNPQWSVSSIIVGLLSFMLESTPTSGSIETTDSVKRIYASQSLKYNCSNSTFCALFPELLDLWMSQVG